MEMVWNFVFIFLAIEATGNFFNIARFFKNRRETTIMFATTIIYCSLVLYSYMVWNLIMVVSLIVVQLYVHNVKKILKNGEVYAVKYFSDIISSPNKTDISEYFIYGYLFFIFITALIGFITTPYIMIGI